MLCKGSAGLGGYLNYCCLGGLCSVTTKPMNALHSHNTKLAHLQVPCSLHVRQNKRGTHLERINTTI